MATFYKGTNNGVVAVVTEDVWRQMQEREALLAKCEAQDLGRPQLPRIGPVFTFSDPKHHSFQFMTGSIELLEVLLKGHKFLYGGLWVPFSNGYEWGWDGDEKQARWEQGFSTSLDEVMEAFGLTVSTPAS